MNGVAESLDELRGRTKSNRSQRAYPSSAEGPYTEGTGTLLSLR
jgi:hypothetical protein